MSINRGVATFTLDTGRCPPWLFKRMVKLGRGMLEVLVAEYGPDEFIKRISDPVWFQSLGTVLAFDWNASGLTTILTAALKEAIQEDARDFGIYICGGKGGRSRKTPDEVRMWGEKLALPQQYADNLVYNSRMSAKVDSSLIQDSFQIYHHALFFTESGAWSVIQQGMNTAEQRARRYHWYSQNITDLIVEPHSGIISQEGRQKLPILNLTARESGSNRELSVDLLQGGIRTVMKDLVLLDKYYTKNSRMLKMEEKSGEQLTLMGMEPREFRSHPVINETFSNSSYLRRIMEKLAYEKPAQYENLLSTGGVGPKTIRALSLVSEVIYGAKPSYRDPARYSFAHGGKDATPYPVDTETYDQSIRILKKVVEKSRMGNSEKKKTLGKLEKRNRTS